MRTLLTFALLVVVALPASARDLTAVGPVAETQTTERERAAEARERARERAEQERERARERAEQERERAAEQRERDRERAQRDRERASEQRQGGNVQTERTTRTLKIGSNGELDIANVSGDIVIARGGGNEATIEIIKTARGRSDADARDLLQLVQVDVIERGTRAEVKARYPQGDEMRRNNRRNINVSVAFNVTAPPGTRVRAASISGSITAKDIKGELSLETVSGSIHVAGAGRVAAAKSISGTVEVVDTDIDGTLEASSVSGSVVLRRVRARAVELGAISGSVVIDDVNCIRVEAQSISGEVRLNGPVTKGARYELTSHSGDVLVAIAGGSGFEIEATSFSGSVRSDFALNSSGGNRGPGKSVRGVYGDGSAILDLTTFSGSIVVSKR